MTIAQQLATETDRLSQAIYGGRLTRWQARTVAQTITDLHRQRRWLRWMLLAMTVVAVVGWLR